VPLALILFGPPVPQYTVGMTEPYQPVNKWRRTRIEDNDPPSDADWMGRETGIERIQLQSHGPTKGKRMWIGHGPSVRKRCTPPQGYEAESREAMLKVEEYYHRLLENNGMANSGRRTKRGNQPPE
jgi:hypothetical protein